jgi:hypothetical protein
VGSAAEEIVEFIEFAAEAVGRIMLFETAQPSDPSFDPDARSAVALTSL